MINIGDYVSYDKNIYIITNTYFIKGIKEGWYYSAISLIAEEDVLLGLKEGEEVYKIQNVELLDLLYDLG